MTTTDTRPVGRETRADRRREIEAAVRALIVEKGIEGLRTRDVAERVGINVATLHYHVPTKQALIEMAAQALKDIFAERRCARPRQGLDPVGRLRAELDDHACLLFERPEVCVIFSEIRERARRDPRIGDIVTAMRADWHRHLAGILAEGRDAGAFRADLDPEAAAWLVISALVGFRGSRPPDRGRYEAVAAEILRLVRAPAAPGSTGR